MKSVKERSSVTVNEKSSVTVKEKSSVTVKEKSSVTVTGNGMDWIMISRHVMQVEAGTYSCYEIGEREIVCRCNIYCDIEWE
jgi:hypothetical protein